MIITTINKLTKKIICEHLLIDFVCYCITMSYLVLDKNLVCLTRFCMLLYFGPKLIIIIIITYVGVTREGA